MQQPDFTVFSRPTGIPGVYPPSCVNIPTNLAGLGVPVLDRTVLLLTSQGLSAATTNSYGSGVHRYSAFCAKFSLQAFPSSELVLCHFVAFLVHEGISYSTIRLYLCAIHHCQLLDGGPDPGFASLHRLHYILRGCHQALPSSVCPCHLPITPTVLRLLHQSWSYQAHVYNIVCMWAACYVAFFAFLRSGEFTCSSWSTYDQSVLSLHDMTLDNRLDPTIIHLLLRRSKTDVFGTNVTIHLG